MTDGSSASHYREDFLSSSLKINLKNIRTLLKDCGDVVYREFALAQNEQIKAALIYTEDMVDKTKIGEVVKTLTLEIPEAVAGGEVTRGRALDFIIKRGICQYDLQTEKSVPLIVLHALSGNAVLLLDGHATALTIEIRGWEKRSINEPEIEPGVRGPREAFVETLQVNISLIRRRLKTPDLKVKKMVLGRVTHTEVVVMYLKGIADEELVAEVQRRLERIDVDGILETGYIEELIEDNPYSPFPTVNHTERPDTVVARLLEGRVAIGVNGTPLVLTVPNLFIEYLQSPEDYYERYVFSSAVRIVRFVAMAISLTLPSLYIAITTYHPSLLPAPLLLSIAAGREATPFPTFVAVLIMEFIFEILREAGIRLPRPIGSAVSIVGALVIGEAAIRASLVSASTVIVVSLTGICSFVFFYSASIPLRLLRFLLIICTGTLGLYGLTIGLVVIVTHLCSLRSFGAPYLSPLVPIINNELKDVLRAPWWAMFTRPRLAGTRNLRRQATDLKPGPPSGPAGRRR